MSEFIYQTETPAFEDVKLRAQDIRIRKIHMDDLRLSLRQGFEDFNENPGSWPLLFLYFPLFVLLFTLFALREESRYLVFPIVAGFTLIGPLVAVGFFEMSKCREQGESIPLRSAFRFVHTHSFAPILALSFIMTLLYMAWLYMAELIYFGALGDNLPDSLSSFINTVFFTREGWGIIFYGNLLGFLFAFAAMAISVVSFTLALDKPVTSMTAVKVSIKAFTENFRVLTAWGIIVAVLMAVGTVLFFLGLAFVMPILGHTTWHLYRKLIE